MGAWNTVDKSSKEVTIGPSLFVNLFWPFFNILISRQFQFHSVLDDELNVFLLPLLVSIAMIFNVISHIYLSLEVLKKIMEVEKCKIHSL